MPSSHRPISVLLALGAMLSGCEPTPSDVVAPATKAIDDAPPAALGDVTSASETPPRMNTAQASSLPDQAAAGQAVDDIAVESGRSIEDVDGALGELEPIRTLLFSDSGLFEETMATHTLGDGRVAVLAIGRADVAAFVVHVLTAAQTQPEAGSRYVVSSLTLPEPADVLDGTLEVAAWEVDPSDQHVTLALDLRHDLTRPGASTESGESGTMPVTRHLTLRFEPKDGSLERVDG